MVNRILIVNICVLVFIKILLHCSFDSAKFLYLNWIGREQFIRLLDSLEPTYQKLQLLCLTAKQPGYPPLI